MHTWRLADAKSDFGQYAGCFEACFHGITRQEAYREIKFLWYIRIMSRKLITLRPVY